MHYFTKIHNNKHNYIIFGTMFDLIKNHCIRTYHAKNDQ